MNWTTYASQRFHRRVVLYAALDMLFGFVGIFVFCIGIFPLALGLSSFYCTYRYQPNLRKGDMSVNDTLV